MSDERLLTTEEVAIILNITPHRVRCYARARLLGNYKINTGPSAHYRFKQRHIADFLRRRESRPVAA